MGRATARAPMDEPSALNAPLFLSLLESRRPSQRQVILDLGSASTAMLSLLGKFPCHVQIADLVSDREFARLNEARPGPALDALALSLLPAHCADSPVDLVLCWDLPNYLNADALSALMVAIAARSRPGTVLHALVVYSERTMPDRPRRYIPLSDGKLVNHSVPTREVPAPRHSPEALGAMMRPFAIDRARLLANGMQEFLFRLAT